MLSQTRSKAKIEYGCIKSRLWRRRIYVPRIQTHGKCRCKRKRRTVHSYDAGWQPPDCREIFPIIDYDKNPGKSFQWNGLKWCNGPNWWPYFLAARGWLWSQRKVPRSSRFVILEWIGPYWAWTTCRYSSWSLWVGESSQLRVLTKCWRCEKPQWKTAPNYPTKSLLVHKKRV